MVSGTENHLRKEIFVINFVLKTRSLVIYGEVVHKSCGFKKFNKTKEGLIEMKLRKKAYKKIEV